MSIASKQCCGCLDFGTGAVVNGVVGLVGRATVFVYAVVIGRVSLIITLSLMVLASIVGLTFLAPAVIKVRPRWSLPMIVGQAIITLLLLVQCIAWFIWIIVDQMSFIAYLIPPQTSPAARTTDNDQEPNIALIVWIAWVFSLVVFLLELGALNTYARCFLYLKAKCLAAKAGIQRESAVDEDL